MRQSLPTKKSKISVQVSRAQSWGSMLFIPKIMLSNRITWILRWNNHNSSYQIVSQFSRSTNNKTELMMEVIQVKETEFFPMEEILKLQEEMMGIKPLTMKWLQGRANRLKISSMKLMELFAMRPSKISQVLLIISIKEKIMTIKVHRLLIIIRMLILIRHNN